MVKADKSTFISGVVFHTADILDADGIYLTVQISLGECVCECEFECMCVLLFVWDDDNPVGRRVSPNSFSSCGQEH